MKQIQNFHNVHNLNVHAILSEIIFNHPFVRESPHQSRDNHAEPGGGSRKTRCISP